MYDRVECGVLLTQGMSCTEEAFGEYTLASTNTLGRVVVLGVCHAVLSSG